MAIMVVLGVVGIVLLSSAADHLVLGAARLAARMRVAPVVVGIVVIGFGTSAPELLVSGAAARSGHTGLAIGNLTGSNVLNLTLVLGLAGVVAPLGVRSSVVRREAPVAVGGVGMFAILLLPGLDLVAVPTGGSRRAQRSRSTRAIFCAVPRTGPRRRAGRARGRRGGRARGAQGGRRDRGSSTA